MGIGQGDRLPSDGIKSRRTPHSSGRALRRARRVSRSGCLRSSSGDCFAVADAYGDIRGAGDGFFRDDTRVLSRFRLPSAAGRHRCSRRIAQPGQRALHRQPDQPADAKLAADATPQGAIHIERAALAMAGAAVRTHQPHQLPHGPQIVPVDLSFAADFRDMFEVRGSTRPRARRRRTRPSGCRHACSPATTAWTALAQQPPSHSPHGRTG